MGTRADHELATFPGYVFLKGQRRVAELFAKLLGWLFLALVDLPTIVSTLDGALAHSGALSPARLEHCRSVAR